MLSRKSSLFQKKPSRLNRIFKRECGILENLRGAFPNRPMKKDFVAPHLFIYGSFYSKKIN